MLGNWDIQGIQGWWYAPSLSYWPHCLIPTSAALLSLISEHLGEQTPQTSQQNWSTLKLKLCHFSHGNDQPDNMGERKDPTPSSARQTLAKKYPPSEHLATWIQHGHLQCWFSRCVHYCSRSWHLAGFLYVLLQLNKRSIDSYTDSGNFQDRQGWLTTETLHRREPWGPNSCMASSIDHRSIHNDIAKKQVEGTGNRFLESKEF